MPHVPVVVVGAGHCGLAMSRCLTERSIDHVVLERGEVANSWRTERWDSLRLLTPNWLSRLPGLAYDGDDPDGYMTAGEVVGLIDRYAQEGAAPVHTHTTVRSLRAAGDGGYAVDTDQGSWSADAVVIASGACNVATVPAVREALPPGITSLTAIDYRNPDQVPEGGVLVVGVSASGIQIADELLRARARGQHRRRRARPDAAPVPRGGHPLVDGGRGRPRRALRPRWTISSGRAACPRCSSPARRARETLDLNTLTAARRPPVRTARGRARRARCCSPGRSPTCAGSPT